MKLVDFSFATPASNAAAERVSISNNGLPNSSLKFGQKLLEFLLIIKYNFDKNYSEFKTFLPNRPNT